MKDDQPRRRKYSEDSLKKKGKELKEDIKKAINKGKTILKEKKEAISNKI